jgi:hypothetical protein
MVAHYVLAPSTAELRVVGDEHSVAVMGVDRELVVGLVVDATPKRFLSPRNTPGSFSGKSALAGKTAVNKSLGPAHPGPQHLQKRDTRRDQTCSTGPRRSGSAENRSIHSTNPTGLGLGRGFGQFVTLNDAGARAPEHTFNQPVPIVARIVWPTTVRSSSRP